MTGIDPQAKLSKEVCRWQLSKSVKYSSRGWTQQKNNNAEAKELQSARHGQYCGEEVSVVSHSPPVPLSILTL